MLSRAEYRRRKGQFFTSLRGMIVISLFLHLGGFALLLLSSSLSSSASKASYSAYRVSLVTLPKETGGQSASSSQKQEQAVAPPSQKLALTPQQVKPEAVAPVQKEAAQPIKEKRPSAEVRSAKKTQVKESKKPEKPKEAKEQSSPPAVKGQDTTKAKEATPPVEIKEHTKPEETVASVPKQAQEEISSTTDSGPAGAGPDSGGQAGASAEGGVPGPAGEEGSIALDSVDFPFIYYLRIIEQKVSQQWTPPGNAWLSGAAKKVVVAFQIQRDGQITKPVVEESSGSEFLDQTAVRAVLSADPLPPLPSEFGKEYLTVHFGFTLSDNR